MRSQCTLQCVECFPYRTLQVNGVSLYWIYRQNIHIWWVILGINPHWIIGYAPITALVRVDSNPKAARFIPMLTRYANEPCIHGNIYNNAFFHIRINSTQSAVPCNVSTSLVCECISQKRRKLYKSYIRISCVWAAPEEFYGGVRSCKWILEVQRLTSCKYIVMAMKCTWILGWSCLPAENWRLYLDHTRHP